MSIVAKKMAFFNALLLCFISPYYTDLNDRWLLMVA